MYYWRRLSEDQRAEVVEYRRIQRYPKHSPPHFDSDLEVTYIITAACYEHASIVGRSHQRLTNCEVRVLSACEKHSSAIYAWCILPNHYHLLVRTAFIKLLRKELGLFHGRTSFEWNGEDNTRGRQVWHNCFERKMRSARHFYASLNYVLHNAVHHGYAERWQDWQWSNASDYVKNVGPERADEIWRKYPIKDYGKKWDVF
jgi:putative transposase